MLPLWVRLFVSYKGSTETCKNIFNKGQQKTVSSDHGTHRLIILHYRMERAYSVGVIPNFSLNCREK